MNPIQQAIEALDEIIAAGKAAKESLDKDIPTGDPVHPVSGRLTWPLSSCLMAVEALRSLNKEVEGVELPPLLPSDHPEPHTLVWSKVEIEAIQDYARTAIAASLGRGAGRPEWNTEAGQRCPHCDGTGDVHSADGTWRGRCFCPEGQANPHGKAPEAAQQSGQGEAAGWGYFYEDGTFSGRSFLTEVEALVWLGSGNRAQLKRLYTTTPTQAEVPGEPWKTSYGVRVGRDNADCIDLIFTKVAAKEFALYPNEAAYLRDLLNAAEIPGFPGKAEASSEREAWDGKRAYHEGRAAYEASVGYFLEGRHKQFWELTSIQQAEFVAKAATRAALATQQAVQAEQAADILQSLGWVFTNGRWVEDKAATATLAQQAVQGEPVAWVDEKGALHHKERHHFLGLVDENCGSADWLWSGTSIEEAGEMWRELVAEGGKNVELTAWNAGVIARHRLMDWRFGERKGAFECPICGIAEPHEHSAEAVALHREDQQFEQKHHESQWAEVEQRIDRLSGLYPARTPLYTASPPSSVQPEKDERRPLTEPELRHVLDGTNNMVRNAMRGPFWPELEEACRAVEAAHGISPSPSMVGREGDGNG